MAAPVRELLSQEDDAGAGPAYAAVVPPAVDERTGAPAPTVSRRSPRGISWRLALLDHPVGRDILLLLLLPLVGVALLLPVRGPDGVEPARTADVLVLGALSALTLVLRRRHPEPVLAATTLLGVAVLVRNGGASPFLVPTLIALYGVAARGPRPRAVAATVGVAVVLYATGLLAGAQPWNAPTPLGLLQLPVLVGAVGMTVAARRQQAAAVVAAAEDRALRAERSRDEEARRRVAEERLRIARELHDAVGHHIAVVGVQAGVAGHLLRTDPATAEQALARIRQASREVLDELAAIVTVLREPGDASGAGATAPVAGLARLDALLAEKRASGLAVRSTVTGRPLPLPPVVDLVAYRLVQEALTNAARHGTGAAVLRLSYEPAQLVVEAENPVRGTPVGAPAPVGAGHGLVGMRERAAAVGGTLAAGEDGGTFRVRATLPLRAEAAR